MRTRHAFTLACLLPFTALAAPPPRPVAAPKPAISEDQVRGWEAVGMVLLGEHAMLRARASCGAGMAFVLSPEQIGPIVEAAVGLPLAQVESAVAAPGWYDYLANHRVAKLLGDIACDADTASFIASELDSIVSLPAGDLRALKGLGKVPAARWPELAGTQREHQTLVFGQLNEFVSLMADALEVAKRCPAAKPRIDALLARADASTSRFVGVRVSDQIAQQLADPNAQHMNADLKERAAGVLSDAGGCSTAQFEEWLTDREAATAALVERSAPTPPLPAAWRQGLH